MRVKNRKDGVYKLALHTAILYLILGMIGMDHLVTNPIVIGAILLSFYDLWIK